MTPVRLLVNDLRFESLFPGIILFLFLFFSCGSIAHAEQDVGDPRGESRTFTTLPEWYIVYSAQEYAHFVSSGHMPTDFPFFAAIKQYWSVSDAITARVGGKTQIDSTTLTILRTIGASFTFEYGITGIYENTVGRVTDYMAFRTKSTEDVYTDETSDAYGTFLNHTPWFDFSYTHALAGLWMHYGWSSLWVRGLERRIAFTAGYSVKALYASIIGYFSNTAYGGAHLTTDIIVRDIVMRELESIPNVTNVVARDDGTLSATLTRYRAFKAPLLEIVKRGGSFVTIQNNKLIMLSLIAPLNSSCEVLAHPLIIMPFVTEPVRARYAVETTVDTLAKTIRSTIASCSDVDIEHFYDY